MSGILSIAQERFSLEGGGLKTYVNERAVSNTITVEAVSDVQPYMNMTGSAPEPTQATTTIVVENLADDGTTVIGSAVLSLPVVYRGRKAGTADVGKIWRIRNTGTGYIHIVAKPTHQVQPFTSL